MEVSRRALGSAGLALGLGGLSGLAGCGGPSVARKPRGVTRSAYGPDETQQFGDLYRPHGPSVGTVVLLHGGYWQAQYGADQLQPMAQDLVERGWTVWNLEYRRIGSGGRWPATFTDVARGVDHLRGLDGVATDRVVVLGHSAGGHLAAWTASRTAGTPGGRPLVGVAGAVSLAGVLDLTRGAGQGLGGGAIEALMGGPPDAVPDRYAAGDPARLRPLAPVALFWGRGDQVVPLDQQVAYERAVRSRGGAVSLTRVDGDHFSIIDPHAASWAEVRAALGRLGR